MATYETSGTAAASAFESSGSPVFTDDAIAQILALTTGGSDTTVTFDTQVPDASGIVTVPAGTEVLYINSSDVDPTTITVNGSPAVIIFQGLGGVDAVVNGPGSHVVFGTAGNDVITVTSTDGQFINGGSGNDTIIGSTGNDTIVAGTGNTTIVGGGGYDTAVMSGTSGNITITQGATVSAGTSGQSPQAATTDHLILTNSVTGQTVDLTGVQYVQLDNNEAVIIATSTVEAGVASLYHAAFGRTGEAGGIGFWFNYANQGLSLHDIAVGFTQSPEFAASAALSNHDFIVQLYNNTFGRAPDAGGLAYWSLQMQNGASRADLLTQFATVAALNEQGVIHTEVTVVGTVVIDPHIV